MNRMFLALGLAFLVLSPWLWPAINPAGAAPRYIAVSDEGMTWEEAVQWCSARGGKLPKINGVDSLRRSAMDTKGTVAIDGVGSVITGPSAGDFTTPWRATGLPGGRYWTGTVVPDVPAFSWYFQSNADSVILYSYAQCNARRAVCVP